ncbi:LacI family DNA-binding transcriptional regulator [Pseudarthrobacter sp. J1738]|uniref:LacI family DNA-binding transcriptional regulator n=1 Tax=unclassified Pseudarthrobacter TaxID=2647000 RepID=UPI003D2DDBCC
MSGIEDVARALGVSTATVSRSIRGLPGVSEKTRRRVMATVDELGYVPSSSASGLATGRTRTIGVLEPFVNRWFFAKAIEGADKQLQAHGYNLMLFNLGGQGSDRSRLFNKAMVQKQIDALLVLCMALNPEELEHMRDIDLPMVVVGGFAEHCPYIGIDDYAAASVAVNHLVDLGHQRIAFLHGQDEREFNFTVARARGQAFEDVMVRHDLEIRPEWDETGDYTMQSGWKAFERLWARPGEKPTAIFCTSDEMAMGVMFAAARAGILVPGQLSVIGMDNHEFAEALGLSTVEQRPEVQGEMATKMVLAELAGHTGSIKTVIAPHRLLARSTTAPPGL